MHVPDGFLNLPTSAATGAVAVAGIALALRAARRGFDERAAPLTGLVAAFVFAAQMVNFPVAAGTSGHLIGAGLAAVLVGPWAATLCLTVVLLIQALLFADGGITALGTNITLMGLVAVWSAWLVVAIGRRLTRSTRGRRRALPLIAGVAAFVSVPAAAATFAGLFLVGGGVPVDAGTLLGAMVGVHFLIGIGEAIITALVVSLVAGVRPDLVFALRPARRGDHDPVEAGVPA